MKKTISIFLLTAIVISTLAAGYKFRNITTATTTTLRTGVGRLVGINVNKAVASSIITVYDNTSAAGTKIATITNPATLVHSQICFPYNLEFRTGLTITTSSTDDITVIYE